MSNRLSFSRVNSYHGNTVNKASPTDIADATAAGLLAQMVERELVSEQTIERCRNNLPVEAQQDHQQLIDALQGQGHVTNWQLKQLRAGQKTDSHLGRANRKSHAYD